MIKLRRLKMVITRLLKLIALFYMNFIRKAKIMFYVHVGHVLRVNIGTGNDTIFAQYFIQHVINSAITT